MEPNRPGAGPSPAGGEAIRGRGTAENPPNRFERLIEIPDGDFLDLVHGYSNSAQGCSESAQGCPDSAQGCSDSAQGCLDSEVESAKSTAVRIQTEYFIDPTRSIFATNKSPDLPFSTSLNPYRGCEHGCIYCYARPTHEYLGFSAGLEFETKILVKQRAPELIRSELSSKRWKPRAIAIGVNTDAYQRIEARLQITRRCLEVFADFRNPISIITKSSLVTRDIDILVRLAEFDAASVHISVTTLDHDLARIMEPRAAPPKLRIDAIAALAAAGIPVGVMIAPIIPGLTEHEIPAIVAAVTKAGAQWVNHVVLRLPFGVAPLFETWLGRHFPNRARKVMNRIRDLRGGRVNDPRFHSRMRGEGVYAEHIHSMMAMALRRSKTPNNHPTLSTEHFKNVDELQLSLF